MLLQWLDRNPGNVTRLGVDLADVARSADWFWRIREIRDHLVHRHAHTLVFPSRDGIQFQIYDGGSLLVREPVLMVNDNVVNFERYAAAVMARLGVLLDAFALTAGSPQLAEQIGNAQSVHPGLGTLRLWALELLEATEEPGLAS